MSHIVKSDKTGKIVSLPALSQACAWLGTVELTVSATPGTGRYTYYGGSVQEGADAVISATPAGHNRLKQLFGTSDPYEIGVVRENTNEWSLETDGFYNMGGLGELVGDFDLGMPKLMQSYRIARDAEIARETGDNFVRLGDGSLLAGNHHELVANGFPEHVHLRAGDVLCEISREQLYSGVSA